jgi:hypothetical protein
MSKVAAFTRDRHVVSHTQDLLDIQAAKVAMHRERNLTGLKFATIVCPTCGMEIEGIGVTVGAAEVQMSKAIEAHFVSAHQG